MGCGCTRSSLPVTATKQAVSTPTLDKKSASDHRTAAGSGKTLTDDSISRQKSYNVKVKKDEILVRLNRYGEVTDYFMRDSLRPGRMEDIRTAYKEELKSEGKGQWPAPSNGKLVDSHLPSIHLQLDYVYGYQCYAARQNLFFLSAEEIVYPCASMAIILHTSSNTQRFIGGGDLTAAEGHTDDVSALAVSKKKDLIATGEIGFNPLICIWKVSSPELPICVLEQGSGSRGVGLLSFSHSAKYLIAVDISSDQCIRVFDLKTRQVLAEEKGYPGHVTSLAFSPKEGAFCSVGVSHLFFWGKASGGLSREKANYGQLGGECSMSTVQYLSNSACVTGGYNGKLYLWESGRLAKVQQVLNGTLEIYALAVTHEFVVTGGQDSKLHVLDLTLKKLRVVDLNDWLKSVDILEGTIICGTRNGQITEVIADVKRVLMETHSEGEVWSLCCDPTRPHIAISSGDDNKIKVWDVKEKRCVATCTIELLAAQNAAHRSSLLPSSQQSRAVAISETGHVAVGHNDGHVSIRSATELETILFTLYPTHTWIRSLKYSPSSQRLAVGASNGLVAVYDVSSNYEEVCTFEGLYASVTSLDWSVDSATLRVCFQSSELRFYNLSTGELIEDGHTALRDEDWAHWSAHRGWAVQGLAEVPQDELFLTCIARSHGKGAVAVGNTWGIIDLYSYPVAPNAEHRSYKAHSLEVANVVWSKDDSLLLTAGGHDLSIMQWKVLS